MASFALNTLKFEDARASIIDYLNSKNEYAGLFDFSNSNLSYFIDTCAYVYMLLAYNTTHTANNVFLDTTEIRKNAVSLAKQVGYTPKRPYSASISGKLVYNGANFSAKNSLTIPARSTFVGSFGNSYLNLNPIKLSYKGDPTRLEGEYTITEGVVQRYKIPASGEANFSFILNNKNVDEDNLSVYVIPSDIIDLSYFDQLSLANYSQYKWELTVPFLTPDKGTLLTNKNIFFVEEDIVQEGFPKIVFGNGLIGAIPPATHYIVCEYLESKGAAANNETLVSLPSDDKLSNSINSYLYYNISELGEENKNIFSVDNFESSIYQNIYNKSFGGADLEELDSIKFNAPKFYSFAGRCVTKSDYLYFLNSLAKVKSANVVGGDELFYDDETKLGNIYISLVPNIDDSEILYNNNLYLSSDNESEIKNQLDNASIISTKRFFYKPSYILVDVSPRIELPANISQSDKSKVYQHIKTLLNEYFLNQFQKLGVKFRESKSSAVIDSLDNIISSYLDLNYYLVINNKTVENMVEDVSNFLYLPIKNVKDVSGKVTGTTNFVKTNKQVVKEEILPDIDWSVLNKTTFDTEAEQESFIQKIKLLNKHVSTLSPEDSSIYGELIHPTISRKVYSRDYTDKTISTLWFGDDGMLRNNCFSFNTINGDVVTVAIITEDNTKHIQFTKYNESTNTYESFNVGTVIYSVLPYEVKVSLNQTQKTNLLEYFYIDESNYVFDDSPFKITKVDSSHFTLQLRMVIENGELAIYGKNTVFEMFRASADSEYELHEDKLLKANWSFEHSSGDTYGVIKYAGDPVAYLERSHSELTTTNQKFKGFISNESSLKAYRTNFSSYSVGDYFIILDNFSVESNGEYTWYNTGDIIFKAANSTSFTKSEVKKKIESTYENNLITMYEQGDVYINDSTGVNTGYLMFDEGSTSITYPNFTPVTLKPATHKLDVSQLLPSNLENNQCIRICIPDDVYSVGGYFACYADKVTSKLTAPLYVRNIEGTGWDVIEDNRLYDGDIIIYSETNSAHVGGGWYLLETVSTVAENSSGNERIKIRATPLPTSSTDPLSYLTMLKAFYKTVKVVDQAITIAPEQLSMFVNPPSDSVINAGDILICVDINSTSGVWKIFDDDYFTYQIDIINNYSSFPIPLNVGDSFSVVVSDSSTRNFKGQLINDTFTDTDIASDTVKISYIGDGNWKKIDYASISKLYSTTSDNKIASVGDVVHVTNLSGNFENSSYISAPIFTPSSETDMMFSYNDVLYYTGDIWIKAYPFNIYNNLTKEGSTDSYRTVLNELGFNADFKIEYTLTNNYNIVLDDIYHDIVIGDINYTTGKIELKTAISGKLNKLENVSDSNAKTLSAIFKYENYEGIPIQVDKLLLKPIINDDKEQETDFDTTFNQYIITNVSDIKEI